MLYAVHGAVVSHLCYVINLFTSHVFKKHEFLPKRHFKIHFFVCARVIFN